MRVGSKTHTIHNPNPTQPSPNSILSITFFTYLCSKLRHCNTTNNYIFSLHSHHHFHYSSLQHPSPLFQYSLSLFSFSFFFFKNLNQTLSLFFFLKIIIYFFFLFSTMAEEGFEHYHIPQQSRREKLRVLSQNQTGGGFLESSSPSLHHPPLPSLYDPSLSDLLACTNQGGGVGGGSVKEARSNLMMRFLAANGSSSSSSPSSSSSTSSSVSHHANYLDPEAIQVINTTTNSNPFLYQTQTLQNLREFNHGYNDGSSSSSDQVMVFKPEPLSLSLSNHHPLELNLQRYGSVNIYGGGSGFDHVSRNTVPLGPFTGYASVLKGSRFLKPAQQLLDEMCDVGVRGICTSQKFTADASLMETPQESFTNSGINGADHDSLGDGNINEGRKNKSRLLTMLDEVYRRYRQYYQQIHTVVTSFEYVAGLGNAAPYASVAINAMSKHFRCLKNVITDQLQFISKSHFQINNNRKDESPRFRNSDGGPYGQRPGFLEHQQQPVWRPQRGLPERAVSVLRAWLFEHFLHPYPTDTDKIMLAKQTGLSRNQVSNWFINARVRLWKPMVEEIHMLESQQAQKKSQREEHGRNNLSDHLPSDNNNIAENPSTSTDKFHDDVPYKRTRNELPNIQVRSQEQQLNQTNTSNHQVGVGVSMGTNGANNGVSLTLGLHQNHGIGLSEPFSMSAAQRFGLAIQPEGYVTSGFHSQNRQFGGQMLHDFVG